MRRIARLSFSLRVDAASPSETDRRQADQTRPPPFGGRLSRPVWALLCVLLLTGIGLAVWESDWMLERQSVRASRAEIGEMALRMPGSAIVQYHYARHLAEEGDTMGAMEALERARAADPRSARVASLLADLLERQARFAEAGALLANFVRRHPNDAEIRYALGVYYYRVFARQQAVNELQQAVRLSPQDVRAWRVLGEAYLGLGRSREAADAYSRALALEPKDYGTLLRRSTAHLEARNLDAAEADRRAAVRLAPQAPDARYALGELLARHRTDLKRQQEGEQELRQALTLAPSLIEAHRELGRLYSRQRRWSEAEVELRAYAAVRPRDPEGLYLYAAALRRQGKPDGAVAAQYRVAKAAEERHRNLLLKVQSEPNNVQARLELAHLLAERGELAFAILSYERALRLAPDNAAAMQALATLRTRFEGREVKP